MAPGAAGGSACGIEDPATDQAGCDLSGGSSKADCAVTEEADDVEIAEDVEMMFCPHCNADRLVRSTYEGKYECMECEKEIP